MIFESGVYPCLPRLLIVQFPQELIFFLLLFTVALNFLSSVSLSVICIAIMSLRLCLITLFYWILHMWCSTPCNEGDIRKQRGWRTVYGSCLRSRQVTGPQRPPVKQALTAAPPTAAAAHPSLLVLWRHMRKWKRQLPCQPHSCLLVPVLQAGQVCVCTRDGRVSVLWRAVKA